MLLGESRLDGSPIDLIHERGGYVPMVWEEGFSRGITEGADDFFACIVCETVIMVGKRNSLCREMWHGL